MTALVTTPNLGADFAIGTRVANKITVIPKQVVLSTPVLGQIDVEDALVALGASVGFQYVVVANAIPPTVLNKPFLWWAYGGTFVVPGFAGVPLTVLSGSTALWDGNVWFPIANGLMTDGNTLTGNSGGFAPTAGTGLNGDFFFDTSSGKVFGAKAGGTWPAVPAYNPAVGGLYTLPPATYTTLGGVKAGAGLSVALDGTLSVNSAGGLYGVGSTIAVVMGAITLATGAAWGPGMVFTVTGTFGSGNVATGSTVGVGTPGSVTNVRMVDNLGGTGWAAVGPWLWTNGSSDQSTATPGMAIGQTWGLAPASQAAALSYVQGGALGSPPLSVSIPIGIGNPAGVVNVVGGVMRNQAGLPYTLIRLS